jgi:hypothetical protein
MTTKTRPWTEVYDEAKARLRTPLWWYPFPAVIAFGLITLLTAHLTLSTSVRMGHPTTLLSFPSEPRADGAIWFSVTPIGNDIVVASASRRVFRWPQNARNTEAAAAFIDWLRQRAQQEIEAAALLNRAHPVQATAVIAADQTLKFVHLRPILYALAEAGITHYGFETLNPTTGPLAAIHDESAPNKR